MPGDSIRTLVMSAEKDAVKRFLSRVHQSWDQLHVETDKVCLKVLSVQKGCISKKVLYTLLMLFSLALFLFRSEYMSWPMHS